MPATKKQVTKSFILNFFILEWRRDNTPLRRRMAGFEEAIPTCESKSKAEHTEQLGTFTLGIVFVIVAHMGRIMQSEASYHALYGHLLVTLLGLVSGGEGN